MSLKDRVKSEGLRLATHPAIAPLLRDERFMKLVMQALSMPGRIEELTEEQRLNLARRLGLAPQHEVDDLKRAVRSLEDEVARLRQQLAARDD